jgi:hypothetical protein
LASLLASPLAGSLAVSLESEPAGLFADPFALVARNRSSSEKTKSSQGFLHGDFL